MNRRGFEVVGVGIAIEISISLEHNLLCDPHRLGPGLAILEYPDELRFPSDGARSPCVHIENGLKYVMPAVLAMSLFGIRGGFDVSDERNSASDSASLMFAVMVIIGGTNGKSSEHGLSNCISSRFCCCLLGKSPLVSPMLDRCAGSDRCGGGDPGNMATGSRSLVGLGD